MTVVIFDLCDTLVRTAGVPGLLTLPGLQGRYAASDVENWFVQSEVFKAYERGEANTDAFIDAFCADLRVRVDRDEFVRVYEALILHEIDGMAELVRQLAARYPLYALSNNNPLLWRATQRICSVLDCFSHIFLSHEIGLLKPDPRTFTHVLAAIDCPPQKSILVDDNPRCIQVAQRIGVQTVHFDGAASAARALSALTHSSPST